jgi:hypothetical protein
MVCNSFNYDDFYDILTVYFLKILWTCCWSFHHSPNSNFSNPTLLLWNCLPAPRWSRDFFATCCVWIRYVGHSSGPKTYYLKNALALLEQALVQFTIDTLIKQFVCTVKLFHSYQKKCLYESFGNGNWKNLHHRHLLWLYVRVKYHKNLWKSFWRQ